jgi:serine/threonine-protein kinase
LGPSPAIVCQSCRTRAPAGQRYCGSCGAVLPASSDSDTTLAPPGAAAPSTAPPVSTGAGFLPGAILANRYRIAGLLGQGGMGEVYRADDLKLGQPVALKFLPADVERDRTRLDRFLSEVRLSLRVTHPNVCRVFDVGVLDAPAAHGGPRHFLSMEYVDGEDLASLLRRIGRLPEDKAIEIARQLCAGLAAAHDEGVLHRDLKPANIMIDGRGRAKIADFGLATVSSVSGAEARVGTPQYMAPEQASGGALTERTDIYALGLVLYELFTGKRAFEIRGIDDLQRLRDSAPTSPSSHVSGLNPLVERAILRCLELDPARRPASAAALAAAMPGGDPLAMVIAAGDTPSPEMVAAAGGAGRLRPAIAWSLVAFVVVASLAGAMMAPYALAYRAGIPEKSPEVLRERARELLASYGFPAPADHIWGVSPNDEFLKAMTAGQVASPLERFGDRALRFWYRESPVLIGKEGLLGPQGIARPSMFDPTPFYSNEVVTSFDRAGRLTWFMAIPMELPDTTTPGTVDWSGMFRAAGLPMADWTAADPKWTPQVYADTRLAWVPVGKPLPDGPVRVEAASYLGRPTGFDVLFPWAAPVRQLTTTRTRAEQVGDAIAVLLLVSVILGAGIVARRNIARERGDTRGAFRVAAYMAIVGFLTWAGDEKHVAFPWELYLFVMNTGLALFVAAFVAVLYLAIEPYVRRAWPHMLVSWSRVVAGTVRDPLVARDVLIGLACAGLSHVFVGAGGLITREVTGIPPVILTEWRPLLGGTHVVTTFLVAGSWSISTSLSMLFLLFALRRLLRNEWAAIGLVALLLATGPGLSGGGVPAILPFLALNLVFLVVLSRVGLIAVIAIWFGSAILDGFPLTIPPAGWTAGVGVIGAIALAALAIVCARVATAVDAPRRHA